MNQNLDIICVCGKKRTGKDTIANYLKAKGYQSIALAELIKESLINTDLKNIISMDDINGLTEFDREAPLIHCRDYLSKVLIDAVLYVDSIYRFKSLTQMINQIRNVIDTYDVQKGVSIRNLMTAFGTDVVTSIDPYYWSEYTLMRVCLSEHSKWIISDVRLSDEVWYWNNAKSALDASVRFLYVYRNTGLTDNHITERGLEPQYDFGHDNVIINNDSTILNLYRQLDEKLKI
ncbi:deoxynucleoside monophosphate kinase [Vibrio phage vB_VmeM-32]|nr:deoxynucleoside monophosphate kinase [Vibrio phage vB_VmeM-32]